MRQSSMRRVPRTLFWIVTGLAAGAGGRWWQHQASTGDEAGRKFTGARITMPTASGRTAARETVEELLALPAFDGRERLVVWLAGATASDVASFAKAWRARGRVDNCLTENLLYLRWAELDPEAMVAFERSMHGGTNLESFAAWAHVDPTAAWTAALKDRNPDTAARVIGAIGGSDPAKARALLAQYPHFLNGYSLEGITEGISRTDLKAGAEAAIRGPGWESAGAPVREWARAEPQQALEWARGISVLERQISALSRIIDEWEGSHPELIGPAIQDLPPSTARESFYENHAAFLARTDPDAAVAWARTAEVSSLRESCLLEAASVIAPRDPAKAEEILRSADWTQSLKGQERSEALKTFARAAPERAMRLAESLPGSESQQAEVFEVWLSRDFDAASRWLEAVPPESLRPSCVSSIINRLTNGYRENYDEALRWALTIPVQASAWEDPRSTLLTAWFRKDPVMAEQIMARPDIPDAVRDQVREVLEAGSRPFPVLK